MPKVLEVAGHASQEARGTDWWWQEQLGKAYYALGLLRDAAKHFDAAVEQQVGCTRNWKPVALTGKNCAPGCTAAGVAANTTQNMQQHQQHAHMPPQLKH